VRPIELARQADGEIADVDHLLYLAQPLLQDLAAFQGHQTPEALLHRRAAPRRRAGPARPCAVAGHLGARPGRPRRPGRSWAWTCAAPWVLSAAIRLPSIGGVGTARLPPSIWAAVRPLAGKNVAMGHLRLLRDRAIGLERMGIGPPGPARQPAPVFEDPARCRQKPQQGGGPAGRNGDRIDGVPG